MSIRSHILEELASVRIDESYDNFEDLPIANDHRKLEKLISQKLTDKYQKLFKDVGSMGVDITIYYGRDDKSGIDDVIKSLEFSIVFDKILSPENVKEVQNICKKNLTNYPDFKYERSDNSFWFEVEKYSGIIGVMDIIIYDDKVNLGKLYKVMDSYDVKRYCDEREKESRIEKQALNTWYNRQRI